MIIWQHGSRWPYQENHRPFMLNMVPNAENAASFFVYLHRLSSLWEKTEENAFIIYELTSKLQYNRAVESHCAHFAKKNTMGKFNLVDTARSLTLLLGSSFILSCNDWLETFAAIGSYSLPFFWVLMSTTPFFRRAHAVIGEDCWKNAQMTFMWTK